MVLLVHGRWLPSKKHGFLLGISCRRSPMPSHSFCRRTHQHPNIHSPCQTSVNTVPTAYHVQFVPIRPPDRHVDLPKSACSLLIYVNPPDLNGPIPLLPPKMTPCPDQHHHHPHHHLLHHPPTTKKTILLALLACSPCPWPIHGAWMACIRPSTAKPRHRICAWLPSWPLLQKA